MSNEKQTNHAERLIENGFLKYADSLLMDSLKSELIKSFNIYSEETFKIASIDAEELAEFSFNFFLPSLNGILAKRNFFLDAQKLSDNEESFDALLNGNIVQLYSQQHLDDQTFWDEAPRNFFKKVNQLLKENGINEQFYLLYGGNVLHVLLLTEIEFSIISDYYNDSEKERPYRP